MTLEGENTYPVHNDEEQAVGEDAPNEDIAEDSSD